MLKKFLLLAAFSLLAGPVLAQNVQQSGNVTRNHAPVWVTSGVIGDGGSSADSPISSFGVTNNGGAGFCVSSDRQSAAGRNQLCFGAATAGAATISLQNYGTASAQALQFIINGTTYPFPGSLANLTIGVTPAIGGSNGNCLIVSGSVVGQQACSSTSITSLIGDVTGTGPGITTTTLASVNGAPGTFGSATSIPIVTVNAKGLTTSVTTAAVGLTIGTSTVVSGTNNGVLFNNAGVVSNTAAGTNGQLFLGVTSGNPLFATMSQDCTITNAGVMTCLKTNNVSFGTSATVNTGTSGATIPLLNGNNTFSGTDIFTAGISVGASAPAPPANTDLTLYSASRSVLRLYQRDQVLGLGSSIGDDTFKGQNASSSTVLWVDNFAAPPFCRGKPSFAGFPCATTTTTAGSEEGAFFIGVIDGSNSLSLVTTASAGIGTATLTFASSVQDSGNLVGKTVTDPTHPGAIPAGTFVQLQTSTTIGLSQNIAAPGVSSGDTITFTGNDLTWVDTNGINLGGQRNYYLPAGFCINSFDSTGTATCILSYNSHANNELDIQGCNNLGLTCGTTNGSIALMTNAAAANGRKVFIDNTENGRTEFRSHIGVQGVTNSTPSTSGAWTVSSKAGGDSLGHVTWSAGTSGTITFGTAFTDSITCLVTVRGGGTGTYTASTSAITLASLSNAGGTLDYLCGNSR